MITLLCSLLGAARSFLRRQRDLALENLVLRHQIGVLERTVNKRRLRLGRVDRGLWAGLSRIWVGWEQALAIVQPAALGPQVSKEIVVRRLWSTPLLPQLERS
jgi:hypothetical protein